MVGESIDDSGNGGSRLLEAAAKVAELLENSQGIAVPDVVLSNKELEDYIKKMTEDAFEHARSFAQDAGKIILRNAV